MTRLVTSAAVATGGFVAVVVLLTRLGGGSSLFDYADPWRVLIQGDAACVTLAAVIAVVVGSVVPARAIGVAIGCAGFVFLGVAAIGTAASWSSYGSASAVGLVIAALGQLAAAPSDDRSSLQAWLIGGAFAGALLARPLDQYRPQISYVDDYAKVGTPTDWPLVIGAGIALVLLAVSFFTAPVKSADKGPKRNPSTGRALALGMLIPFATLLVWWWFVSTEVLGDDMRTGTTTWAYGILLLPLVIGGVLWMPGRDGLVLLGMLATLATAAALPKWYGSWPVLVVFVALIVGGLLTGRRRPYPLSAMVVLVVCTLVNITDQSPWDAVGIGAAFVVPAVGGHLIAACLPTTAGLSTTAVTSPATLYAVTGISFGWVAYGGGPSGFDGFTPSTTELVLSVVTVVACAGAAAVIIRRRPSTDAESVPT